MSNGMIVLAVVAVLVALVVGGQLWMAAKARRAEGKPTPIPGDGVLFFYSPTCAPCHAMWPHVEALAEERGDVRFIDVSVHPEIAQAFGVMATPTTIVVRDDLVVEVRLGALSEGALRSIAA